MSSWVYEFSGCPDTDAYQQFANEAEPGEILFRIGRAAWALWMGSCGRASTT